MEGVLEKRDRREGGRNEREITKTDKRAGRVASRKNNRGKSREDGVKRVREG